MVKESKIGSIKSSEGLTAKSSRFHLPVPGTKDKHVQIDVEIVPEESVPETLRNNTNVAKMKIGGKDFLIVAGKTVLHEE